jgi:hypothetical protein
MLKGTNLNELVCFNVRYDVSKCHGWSKSQAVMYGPANEGIGIWAKDYDDAKRILKLVTAPHKRMLTNDVLVEPMAGRKPLKVLFKSAGYLVKPVQLLPARKRTDGERFFKPYQQSPVRLDVPPKELT